MNELERIEKLEKISAEGEFIAKRAEILFTEVKDLQSNGYKDIHELNIDNILDLYNILKELIEMYENYMNLLEETLVLIDNETQKGYFRAILAHVGSIVSDLHLEQEEIIKKMEKEKISVNG